MSAVQNLRDEVATLTTESLIESIKEIEDANPTSDEQEVRVVYGVMCAEACRRLDLDPQAVASSTIGPAATFAVAAL